MKLLTVILTEEKEHILSEEKAVGNSQLIQHWDRKIVKKLNCVTGPSTPSALDQFSSIAHKRKNRLYIEIAGSDCLLDQTLTEVLI